MKIFRKCLPVAWLVVCFCFIGPLNGLADGYKQVNEYLRAFLPGIGAYYEYDVRQEHTKQLIGMALDSEATQMLTLNPGDKVMFFGPPGSFLVSRSNKGKNILWLPADTNLEELKKDIIRSRVIKAKTFLYAGYYYPDKYTGAPNKVPPDQVIYLYILKPSFFKDQKETAKPASDNGEKPVHFENVFEIKPLINKSGWVHFASVISCIFFFSGLTAYFILVKKNGQKKVYEPEENSSMRGLFKTGTRKFFCRHCGAELKIIGRFECRLGHIPQKDRYVFKKCNVWQDGKKCNDVFEYMRCNHCGKELSLDEVNYNEEEIVNRGKDYILRKSPLKRYIIPAYCGSFLVAFMPQAFAWINRDNNIELELYQSIYSWYDYQRIFDPSIFYLAACLIIGALIVAYTIFMTDDVIVRNPYDRKKV